MPRLRGTDSKRTDSHRRRGEHGVEAPAPDRAGRRSVPEHAPSETTDSFQLFLNQASRYPLLTREEEVDLAQRIERGDLAAKELLINSNLRLVVKFARRYEGHGLPIQDLVQEAMLGLIRAAEKFDWRRGYKFSTYAVLWIKQSIQRGLDNTGRPVRIPAHVAQRERTVNRVDAELSTKLNREPTDEEVARAAKLPLDEVQAVKDLTRVTTSLDAPIGDGDTSLGELRGGTEPSVEEEVVGRDREDAVEPRYARCRRTSARDRAALRHGQRPGGIAPRRGPAAGVTQARARELEARGLRGSPTTTRSRLARRRVATRPTQLCFSTEYQTRSATPMMDLAGTRQAAVELAAGRDLAHVIDIDQSRHRLSVDVLQAALALDRPIGGDRGGRLVVARQSGEGVVEMADPACDSVAIEPIDRSGSLCHDLGLTHGVLCGGLGRRRARGTARRGPPGRAVS